MRLRIMIPTAALMATIPPTPIPPSPEEFELSGALGLEAFTVGLSDGGVATRGGGGRGGGDAGASGGGGGGEVSAGLGGDKEAQEEERFEVVEQWRKVED
ncbi:hypothetical protein CCACVL1_11589 [Corchorus capsularis]|uniref:Uncharacterized protein n=1 Tax=Corchorus capsularis TaxID=210143 RepID=A0A1R3IKC9_COCAP|nr:hypothetical protein CCACVL1_11589 [Corchorus capsularis]